MTVRPSMDDHRQLFRSAGTRARWTAFIAGVTGLTLFAFACDSDTEATAVVVPSVDASVPDTGSSGERVKPPPSASPEGNVVTYAGTPLGLAAFSTNGRIQPHGAPTTYHFEYGPTIAYGAKTAPRALAPRLAAHYRESWDAGLGGWRAGSGDELMSKASGGVSGGYVRFSEPSGDDFNHIDGIGILHLVQYFYVGFYESDAPTVALGGGHPDFRDARVRVSVRGVSFKPRGADLVWWSQVDVAHGNTPDGKDPKYSNWAYTGFALTDALVSGNWETVEYRLYEDTTQWTYAGSNAALNAELNRSDYVYTPLDNVLSDMDTDLFHVLTPIDNTRYPVGSIDFDDFEVAYRNHSLLFPSNGGKLVSSPPGSSDAATLTDGWRVGAGKVWTSAPRPTVPLEIVYELEQPVTIERVQLQQHAEFPSKDVEVEVSADGVTWTLLTGGEMPESHPAGPGFAYLLTTGHNAPAKRVRVRILSGYRSERWGLGEIEVFGKGGVLRTDDDWYRVSSDITGLEAGKSYHYRLVAAAGDKLELGGDQIFVMPADTKPEVSTRGVSQLASQTARLGGRMNSLGKEAQWYFEYGPDTSYGERTPDHRTGIEITQRSVYAVVDGLPSGKTIHYRLVARSVAGTTFGNDATFVVP